MSAVSAFAVTAVLRDPGNTHTVRSITGVLRTDFGVQAPPSDQLGPRRRRPGGPNLPSPRVAARSLPRLPVKDAHDH